MNTLFIYNPQAGKKQIKNYLYEILNCLAKADYDLTIRPTKEAGEALNYLKKNTSKYDMIICSGGDGTLNEVINGMLLSKDNRQIPLGYIPAGSTNDFANSIKLPSNMEKAALTIINKKPKTFDVGKFNNRYFIYVAAFGAFTSVAYDTPQETKNMFGHFAYIFEGIKSITDLKSYDVKIKYDKNVIEDKFIYGMITNSYTVGGIYKLSKKEVKLDDGLFEVLLIKQPKDILEMNEITSYLIGAIKHSNCIVSFKTNKLTLQTNEKLPWTLDGEYGGSPNEVNIKVINNAISIIQ